jgi:hypothetical protein
LIYSIRDRSNKCWLKFITPDYPTGLWAGAESARTFDTKEAADHYLTKLTDAIAAEAFRDMGRLLDGPLDMTHKVTRFFAIANNAGCDLECYEVCETQRTSNNLPTNA